MAVLGLSIFASLWIGGTPVFDGASRAAAAVPLSLAVASTNVTVNLTGASPWPLAPAFFGVDVRVDSAFGSTQVGELNRTAVRYVVWPGGAIADRYDAVTNQLYSTSGAVSTPTSNESEFVQGCRTVGCHAILQVPAEIDDPSIAVAEINYTIHTLGFTPDYIEIGNEPALWTHFGTPWSQWSSGNSGNATPATYATVVQQYIAAIRAVDATAKFVGLPGVGQGASPEPSWLYATVKLNGPNLSAVAVHVYPGGSSSPSSPTLTEFFAQLSNSASLPVRVPKDRAAMSSACAGCGSIPILVTELGASGSSTSFDGFMAGFPNVPYIATELIQGMVLNLSSLDDFAFQNSYPGSWFAPNGTAAPTYSLYCSILPAIGGEFVPIGLAPSLAGLSVALTKGTANGFESLLVANTNLTSVRVLNLSELALPSGAAELTWWNSSSGTPVSQGAARSPNTFAIAPESVGLLSVSGGSPAPGPANGTIEGKVVGSATGEAVVGTDLVATTGNASFRTSTNSTGAYELVLPAGAYTVDATAPGFVPENANVSVAAGGLARLDFSLNASPAAFFSVQGHVEDAATGGPVSGAQVFVSNGTASRFIPVSLQGDWSISLPNGTYTLTATAAGFDAVEVGVTVAGQPSGSVALALEPSGTAGAAASGGQVPPTLSGFLLFLPSLGAGLIGYVSWYRFLRARPLAGAKLRAVRSA